MQHSSLHLFLQSFSKRKVQRMSTLRSNVFASDGRSHAAILWLISNKLRVPDFEDAGIWDTRSGLFIVERRLGRPRNFELSAPGPLRIPDTNGAPGGPFFAGCRTERASPVGGRAVAFMTALWK